MKFNINGKWKELSDLTAEELHELVDTEFEKTEKCWRFWKPFYIGLFVAEALLFLFLIIGIIIMLL